MAENPDAIRVKKVDGASYHYEKGAGSLSWIVGDFCWQFTGTFL